MRSIAMLHFVLSGDFYSATKILSLCGCCVIWGLDSSSIQFRRNVEFTRPEELMKGDARFGAIVQRLRLAVDGAKFVPKSLATFR